jgi:hypothetical protein
LGGEGGGGRIFGYVTAEARAGPSPRLGEGEGESECDSALWDWLSSLIDVGLDNPSLIRGWVDIRILLPQAGPYFRWRPHRPQRLPSPSITQQQRLKLGAPK